MPRCKIAMRLIDNARARAATYAKRRKGLQKKAEQLAELCGIPVALVCAYPGGGAPVVWESEAGVLDRYRALLPEVRAWHTHGDYLEGELGKERAKLARVRQNGPGALAGWDATLNDMTLDEARELLETIDAALRATSDRLVALGLPADGQLEQQIRLVPLGLPTDGQLEQQITPGASDAAVMPLLGHGGEPCTESNPVDMDAGFQLQMMPAHGSNDDDGRLDQFSWDDCLEMHNAVMMGTGGNYLDAVDGYQMQAPGYGDAHYGWPDLTMWHTDESSCNAVLPVGCYPSLGITGDFIDGTLAPEHSALGTGADYINSPPLTFDMRVSGNITSHDGYAAHWSADEFQTSGTGAGTDYINAPPVGFDMRVGTIHAASSPQCSDPGTRSCQVFHYLW